MAIVGLGCPETFADEIEVFGEVSKRCVFMVEVKRI